MNQSLLPPQLDKLSFRPMTLEDTPCVHQIDVLSFTLPWPEKSFIFELTQNPASLCTIAEVTTVGADPRVVGMSVVWILVDEAHIATIAIHPDFRGRGYGKQLLAEILRRSIQRGARLATLEVRAGNLVAQRMYHEFGFVLAGRRFHYYHDNDEDAIIMTVENIGEPYLTWLDKWFSSG